MNELFAVESSGFLLSNHHTLNADEILYNIKNVKLLSLL